MPAPDRVPDRFAAHPDARLSGPDGPSALTAADAPAVIGETPCTAAIAAALYRAALGLPFRIGAPDLPPPDRGARPAFETLTSGSTGAPRRIRRSQRSWCASFAVNARIFAITPGTRTAVLGRMVHSLSLYGALEGACLGAETHLLAALRPDAQHRALSDRAVEILYATPAQLRRLAEAAGTPLPALRLILVGGSKLDLTLRAALAVLAPRAVIREFYGAAEASFVTLTDATTPEGSVGRPYPQVQLSIRNPEGTDLPRTAVGEVWVRSPYLCDRYADRRHLPPLKRRGWLSVGEMGWLDHDGNLHLAGRAGRMVTVADQNVFPEEIETFLATLPGVTRAVVLPKPDLMRGHVLIAVCTGDPAQEDAILRAARARLGPLKAPRRIHWRGDWPETPSGKPDLTRLAAEVPPGSPP